MAQLFPGQQGADGVSVDRQILFTLTFTIDVVGELFFACLQGENLLLHGAFGDQLVDEHRLILTDTVGTVCRLSLNSRVPPGVVVDHGVGFGEVEANAARFEGDSVESAFDVSRPGKLKPHACS